MANNDKTTVDLFVRASNTNKLNTGPCPISQKWFMAFYILVERQCINLRLTPIVAERPSENYVQLGFTSHHFPVVHIIHGVDPKTQEDFSGQIAETDDDLERLMSRWSHLSKLQVTSESFHAIKDIYRNFNSMLKTGNKQLLEGNLNKVENYLKNQQTTFLDGDDIGYADCQLMPKLQHIIVAGKVYKNFTIPFELINVWRYIDSMYKSTAFIHSCPSDADIENFYYDKVVPPPKVLRRGSITSGESIDFKTLTIPDDII